MSLRNEFSNMDVLLWETNQPYFFSQKNKSKWSNIQQIWSITKLKTIYSFFCTAYKKIKLWAGNGFKNYFFSSDQKHKNNKTSKNFQLKNHFYYKKEWCWARNSQSVNFLLLKATQICPFAEKKKQKIITNEWTIDTHGQLSTPNGFNFFCTPIEKKQVMNEKCTSCELFVFKNKTN